MIPFAQYLVTVAVLLLAAAIFVLAYGIVAYEIHKLLNLVSEKRKTTQFFKKIEEFRRDFA